MAEFPLLRLPFLPLMDVIKHLGITLIDFSLLSAKCTKLALMQKKKMKLSFSADPLDTYFMVTCNDESIKLRVLDETKDNRRIRFVEASNDISFNFDTPVDGYKVIFDHLKKIISFPFLDLRLHSSGFLRMLLDEVETSGVKLGDVDICYKITEAELCNRLIAHCFNFSKRKLSIRRARPDGPIVFPDVPINLEELYLDDPSQVPRELLLRLVNCETLTFIKEASFSERVYNMFIKQCIIGSPRLKRASINFGYGLNWELILDGLETRFVVQSPDRWIADIQRADGKVIRVSITHHGILILIK